jgi:hypothetical protein
MGLPQRAASILRNLLVQPTVCGKSLFVVIPFTVNGNDELLNFSANSKAMPVFIQL